MKKNIAIDGPAGSGKSTIAQLVADKLGYIYISTGLMYRAIAFNAISKGIDLDDEVAVENSFKINMIKLLPNNVVKLNGISLTDELRQDVISNATSKIAKYASVREKAVKSQQNIAKAKGYVMDGRDITSVVLPDAEVKIFMFASPEIRAKRRVTQNKEMGFAADYKTILKEINDRDYNDMHRESGALIQVKDAVKINTTDKSVDEVVDIILNLV